MLFWENSFELVVYMTRRMGCRNESLCHLHVLCGLLAALGPQCHEDFALECGAYQTVCAAQGALRIQWQDAAALGCGCHDDDGPDGIQIEALVAARKVFLGCASGVVQNP